ncbi:MAG: PhzF family phenazine biosynthesis protein [Pseudomonadota bacterium]
MSAFDYVIYDVFTRDRFSGNPLAVVFDADELSGEQMQAIAGEFNLSETSFVCAPDEATHTAKLRIFTPTKELPFAGHPTVGSAVAYIERSSGDASVDHLATFEEKLGVVRCALKHDGAWFAEFDAPALPRAIEAPIDREAFALALGVEADDLYLENHKIRVFAAGNVFVFVPVRDLSVMQKMAVDGNAIGALAPVIDGEPAEIYAYCRETVDHTCHWHSRMFAPHMGIPEDPATGSAAFCFAGAIQRFDGMPEGPNVYWIEQGVEMGRPSRIRLEVSVKNQSMTDIRIGGHAVKVAEGRIDV